MVCCAPSPIASPTTPAPAISGPMSTPSEESSTIATVVTRTDLQELAQQRQQGRHALGTGRALLAARRLEPLGDRAHDQGPGDVAEQQDHADIEQETQGEPAHADMALGVEAPEPGGKDDRERQQHGPRRPHQSLDVLPPLGCCRCRGRDRQRVAILVRHGRWRLRLGGEVGLAHVVEARQRPLHEPGAYRQGEQEEQARQRLGCHVRLAGQDSPGDHDPQSPAGRSSPAPARRRAWAPHGRRAGAVLRPLARPPRDAARRAGSGRRRAAG